MESAAPATPTLSARLHAELRADILSGRHAPGDALPSERQLAEQLGASRHAVREALKRLQQAGLVTIAQGGATRVRDWRRHGGLELLLGLAAEGEAPPELHLPRATMELRACIGADAARHSALRANAAARAELRAWAERFAAVEDPAARNAHYEAFWDLIVGSSDNIAYRLALSTLLAGQQVLAMEPGLLASELDDVEAVRALTEAIVRADADGAGALARDLLERSIPEG